MRKPALSDLKDCISRLDLELTPLQKNKLKEMPVDELVRLHLNFGMQIRNRFGLWKNTKLRKYFKDMGIDHADDMSQIIIVSYHRHLNKRSIKLKEQIRKDRPCCECNKFKKDVKQRIDNELGCGFHCDKCWDRIRIESRQQSW